MFMWIGSIVVGFIVDSVLGDPRSIPHPVIFIGKFLSFMEKILRKIAGNGKYALILAGIVEVVIVLAFTAVIPCAILKWAGGISVWFEFFLSCVMSWQILAARSLKIESMKVYTAMESGDIEAARHAVSMIVGRDTAKLSKEGIIKAAVETVAENTSDGVTAPLIYLFLGGPVLGFVYKAVNTMDSMIGYKNEKYIYFGRCAARLDDVLNYIPARATAFAMILVCPVLNIFRKLKKSGAAFHQKEAYRIWKRDRRRHASPNSAQTEATCAGALEIGLAGDAWYGGVLHKKEQIGDGIRAVEPGDIKKAVQLMYASAILMLVIFCIFMIAFLFGRRLYC